MVFRPLAAVAVLGLLGLPHPGEAFQRSYGRLSAAARLSHPWARDRRLGSLHRVAPAMLVEKDPADALRELSAQPTGLQKKLQDMSPKTAKALNVGLVPAAAAIAGVVVPGGPVISLGMAAVAAYASNRARTSIGKMRRGTCTPALADLLIARGVDSVTYTELAEVAKIYGVEGVELQAELRELFAKYFIGMMGSPVAQTSELAELLNIKDALGLDGETMGDAVYLVACDVYAKQCSFSESSNLDDPDSLENAYIDKFLWLAQRVFVVGDTEEAATYEMSRITKVFDMSDEDLGRRLLGVATPFYESALDKAIGKLGEFKNSALQKAANRVGLPTFVVNAMHADTYRREVQTMLRENDNRLGPEASERLKMLAELLNVPDSVVDHQNAAVTRPLLRDLMSETLEAVGEGGNPLDLGAKVLSRMADLQVPVFAADRVIADAIMSGLAPHYAEAVQQCRVRNKLGVVDALRQLLVKRRRYRTFLDALRTGYGADRLTKALDRAFRAYGEQARKDTVEMYATFVQHTMGGSAVLATKEQVAEFEELSTALGLAEDVARSLRQSDSLPRLKDALKECFVNGTFTEEQRDSNLAYAASLGVPLGVYVGVAKDMYKEELDKIAGGSTVFSAAERKRLGRIRVFLDLTEEEVAPMHYAVSGPTFKKALLESFGVTGQIAKEVRESLNVLRERLMLQDESCEGLFLEAIKERMEPMVSLAAFEFEKATNPQAQQARRQDMGEDVYATPGNTLGMAEGANFITEALTIVEFFQDNNIRGIKDEEAPEAAASELEAVTGMRGKPENGTAAAQEAYALHFPVNATGLIRSQMLEDMYKHFVVSAFTAKPAQKERMEKANPALAGILGLDTRSVRKVHSTIGRAVYSNYLNAALERKLELDQQDFAFLGSMRGQLGLAEDEATEMLDAAKKRKVRGELDMLISRGQVKPQFVTRLRMMADSMGVDLVEDLELDLKTRKKLFKALTEGVVEDFSSDASQLEDLAEELMIPDDDAETMLRDLLVDRCRSAAGNAFADARAGRSQRSIAELERLLRLARFAPDVVELTLSPDLAKSIVNMYENAGPAGTGPQAEAAVAKTRAGLLRKEAARGKAIGEGVSHGGGADQQGVAHAAELKAAELSAAADFMNTLSADEINQRYELRLALLRQLMANAAETAPEAAVTAGNLIEEAVLAEEGNLDKNVLEIPNSASKLDPKAGPGDAPLKTSALEPEEPKDVSMELTLEDAEVKVESAPENAKLDVTGEEVKVDLTAKEATVEIKTDDGELLDMDDPKLGKDIPDAVKLDVAEDASANKTSSQK